jgi:hypothetical protein
MTLDAEVWTPVVIPREDFASSYFDYEPGQKVVFGGRTQEAGKTTLAFKLLEYTATPELPAYIICSKGRDPVTEAEGKRLGYRFTNDWPVEPKFKELAGNKPAGYIIQAKYGDLTKDADKAARISNAVLLDRYKAGTRGKASIIVADDTVVLSKLLGQDKEMVTIIALGGAMDVGLWIFVQKPTNSGNAAIWGFENAEHTFLSKPKDIRAFDRYGEIGGQDKKLVIRCLEMLKKYQFLYLSGAGYMCIVDSK